MAERIERVEKLLSQKLGSEESSTDTPLILVLLPSTIIFVPTLYLQFFSQARKREVKISSSRHLSLLSKINLFVGRDTNKNSSAITKIGTRITPKFSSSLGNLNFAGFKLREISSYNSIPLFLPEGQQWIKSRTGQTVTLEKFYACGPPWQNQRNLNMNSVPRDLKLLQDNVHLPDREIVEELTLGYSSHILSLVFPTIDKVLFEDTINLAYYQGSFPPTGHASAKACVYAFLAFVSIFSIHSGSGTGLPLDSEAYAWKAQSLATEALQDITTDSLQTAVMLVSNPCFHILMFFSVR